MMSMPSLGQNSKLGIQYWPLFAALLLNLTHNVPLAVGYEDCSHLTVKEVGFNYVQFGGALHKVRAIELDRTSAGILVEKPIFYKFASDFPGEWMFGKFSGHVPLLTDDGFRPLKWYLVCGQTNHDIAGTGCEECVVLRFCDCDCDSDDVYFLKLTTGKVPVKDNWSQVGIMVKWEKSAMTFYPFQDYIHAMITWKPYKCQPVDGEPDLCRTPSIDEIVPMEQSSGAEIVTLDKIGMESINVTFDYYMDFSEIKLKHPNFNVQHSYGFSFGPYEFGKARFRDLHDDELPLIYPKNNRSVAEIKATCRKIMNDLDDPDSDDWTYWNHEEPEMDYATASASTYSSKSTNSLLHTAKLFSPSLVTFLLTTTFSYHQLLIPAFTRF